MPTVEYEEDGSVWVYYYNQKIDVTDSFVNGVCYVKLVKRRRDSLSDYKV